MGTKKKVFSDSWDRVADRHAQLLPGVDCHSQFYRGESWRILRAPYANEFYRLTEEAWGFVARLSMDVTINEAWQQAMERDPEGAPGQEEAIEILGQLSGAGLILSDLAADSREIFRSKSKERWTMFGKQALNFLFLRIPLFNPDPFLSAIRPFGQVLMHPLAFLLWLFIFGWGTKSVIENWDLVLDQSAGFLSPDNLVLVLVATVVLKLMHELGHGIACKHFGGYVPTFGIMFILFAPLPFVDATASWGFREKWRRIFVSSAGIYVELFIAAVAAVVWAHSGEGTLGAIAYNVMLIGSVTTLLFNMNPLLKFDGYYILSDLFSLPNLQQRSGNYLQYLLERYAFGRDEADNPADHSGEAIWLGFYGISAGIYRVFLMLSISMIVGQQFFELGIALAVFTLIVYIFLPILKFIRYLLTARELVHCRRRALLVVAAVVGLIVAGLGVVPVPEHFQEPGIVRPFRQVNVSPGFAGRMIGEPRPTGQWVEKEDLLFELENPDHDHEIEIAEAALQRLKLRMEVARIEAPASVVSLQRMVDLEEKRLGHLLKQRESLRVFAPISGYWVSVDFADRRGAWFDKGETVGQIRDPRVMEFLAVISQQRAADSFRHKRPQAVGVRLWGEAGQTIPLADVLVVPGAQRALPSAALGWMGGGDVKVKQDDPEGVKTEERFYLLRGQLADPQKQMDAGAGSAAEEVPFLSDASSALEQQLLSDRTGEVRIRVGERAIALQIWDAARKSVQRRLKI